MKCSRRKTSSRTYTLQYHNTFRWSAKTKKSPTAWTKKETSVRLMNSKFSEGSCKNRWTFVGFWKNVSRISGVCMRSLWRLSFMCLSLRSRRIVYWRDWMRKRSRTKLLIIPHNKRKYTQSLRQRCLPLKISWKEKCVCKSSPVAMASTPTSDSSWSPSRKWPWTRSIRHSRTYQL